MYIFSIWECALGIPVNKPLRNLYYISSKFAIISMYATYFEILESFIIKYIYIYYGSQIVHYFYSVKIK